jgi:hypothetical protein
MKMDWACGMLDIDSLLDEAGNFLGALKGPENLSGTVISRQFEHKAMSG